jgi:NAD(P)-dependent dehydrogenase (short-subunit alcohol dehydrogenase family)
MPTVLITGTSTGIGHVTTQILAARGWRVFATMRDLAKKDSLERILKMAGLRQQVTIKQLDINDPASIQAAVAFILSQTGNMLDAVVHNAGVAVAGAHEDLPEAEIRRVMETNFFGVLALTRALLPTFRAQRGGRIVLVSSQAAFAGQPANSIYCASKWALEGWAEALAY